MLRISWSCRTLCRDPEDGWSARSPVSVDRTPGTRNHLAPQNDRSVDAALAAESENSMISRAETLLRVAVDPQH
jgi:hypothetical protein